MSSERAAQPSIPAERREGVPGTPMLEEPSGPIAGCDEQPRKTFPTLHELQDAVNRLERELRIDRANNPLSGRIIHVAHKMPFVLQSMAEVEHHERLAAQTAAVDRVAQLAQAARARRAEREAREAEQAAQEEQRALQRQYAAAIPPATHHSRRSSFWGQRSRRASGAAANALAGMRSAFLDNIDLETKLMENQERSRRRAGRRAWMMTEVVDDTSEASEDDRFSPIASRRNSRYTHTSSSSVDIDMPSWMPQESGISDQASPATPPEATVPTRPPWYLSLTSVSAAMNSGVYALCATHAQTYIACPENVLFAAQAHNDMRTDVSQATEDRKSVV